MGLNTSTSNNSVVFLSVSNGKISRMVDSGTEGSIQRQTKSGKIVHELFYTSLEGIIKEVKTRDTDWGKFWNVLVESNGINYRLEFNYSGGYAQSFLKALPNVQIDKIVTISPKLNIDGDKKKGVILMSQEGKGIKHYYTKDHPNGLPELKKIKVSGKEVWDDTERMEFLEKKVVELFDDTTPF